MMNMKDSLLGWPATFFRHIGPSDSKIHMLMSEVVNKSIVEGFVKKMSTSWVNRFFVALREAFF